MKNRRTKNQYHKSRAESFISYNKVGKHNSRGVSECLDSFLNDSVMTMQNDCINIQFIANANSLHCNPNAFSK